MIGYILLFLVYAIWTGYRYSRLEDYVLDLMDYLERMGRFDLIEGYAKEIDERILHNQDKE